MKRIYLSLCLFIGSFTENGRTIDRRYDGLYFFNKLYPREAHKLAALWFPEVKEAV